MDEAEWLHFSTVVEWHEWLAEHHSQPTGVWLVGYKARTGKPAISYEETVREALCYGWIDSTYRSLDDQRGMPLDLTDRGSIDAAVAAAVERFGQLDILVNNAGLGFNHDAVDVTEQDWDELMDVNVRGLFFACQSAARQMLPRGYGRIINMAS